MDNNTIIEASPIKTIKDLLAWSVVDVHPKLMGKPLSTSVKVKGPDEPKTLVCHDMRGNYLEDKFPSGCPVDSVYYVTQWWYMDVFVYFSHNLVTIPPVGWINAAHLHGVSVLGRAPVILCEKSWFSINFLFKALLSQNLMMALKFVMNFCLIGM